ncbi:MAG: NAD-dependent epimerase/dehydratase family protein [Halobacteriovoraceae bacterium]|jgi:UDP-glucose 4-epimerase|nr:NAD-dependent epimerase/dehydratase family protein [Halobacteriovoraceae bacterium]
MEEEVKKVLIIGIRGALAQILSRLILENHPTWEILGLDARSVSNIPKQKGLIVKKIRYSRGSFENIFRDHSFDYVYHLARVSHSTNNHSDFTQRLELNVMGTNRILDLSLRFNVKKIIILSTFHVYGALSDNSIFLKEDAPLRASLKFPELRDVVEMDQICSTWIWKYQSKIDSVLLRPCNIVGTEIANSMSQYLKSHLSLKPIDYNPIFQFIHEFDMANVLYRSINDLPTGIYNVATDEFITLRKALKIVGGNGIPFPISLASVMNNFLNLTHLGIAPYLVEYLKYSCLIDNSSLKKHLGDDIFRFKMDESLKLIS